MVASFTRLSWVQVVEGFVTFLSVANGLPLVRERAAPWRLGRPHRE